ncbi:hypothetical protein C4M98_06600 [Mycoplasmopsis pullorum]|nr:hypothetical protein C4M98_06600 [Mycoplasmopsis pullorum]TNK92800.1 hypothetical protein C4M95_06075 [Mycoplasmopsis pullorum]
MHFTFFITFNFDKELISNFLIHFLNWFNF